MTGNDTGIRSHIEMLDPLKKYLINFSPFFINQIPAELLKEMVVEKRRSVLYICVGRPHVFVQKSLKNRGVSPSSIYFMDMILKEDLNNKEPGNSRFTFGASERNLDLSIKFDLFKDDREITEMDLDKIDMMIIDNLSELRTHKSIEQIESFIRVFSGIADMKKNGLFMLHLNNMPGDGIPEIADSIDAEIIDISSDASR